MRFRRFPQFVECLLPEVPTNLSSQTWWWLLMVAYKHRTHQRREKVSILRKFVLLRSITKSSGDHRLLQLMVTHVNEILANPKREQERCGLNLSISKLVSENHGPLPYARFSFVEEFPGKLMRASNFRPLGRLRSVTNLFVKVILIKLLSLVGLHCHSNNLTLRSEMSPTMAKVGGFLKETK